MNSPAESLSRKQDFPLLADPDRKLHYLDSAASTQKPASVIEALSHFYSRDYANIHRGVYELSARATESYENAREKVRTFLSAGERREIIFTRGTTESINLLARAFLRPRLREGDEILLSALEHHSNIVPWQIVAGETGARIRVIPMNARGELLLDSLDEFMGPKTRLLALAHVSNALGSVNPVKEIIARAHEKGIPVLLDGAQSAPHMPVDVQDLDCDFFAFSGHKCYGPTGIGVLYGRAELLEKMDPWQGGGDMILTVSFEKSQYAEIPAKFEAGTPPIAQAIGLGAAIDYLQGIGMDRVYQHGLRLQEEALLRLREVPGFSILGDARERIASISFLMDDIHPHDLGTFLDQQGIAIRAGHHCAQPVMDFFGIPGTTRASFGLYNDSEDVEALVSALHKAREFFRV